MNEGQFCRQQHSEADEPVICSIDSTSQGIEEFEQLILWHKARGLVRLELGECCDFEGNVGIKVDLGGLDGLMAEPQCDDEISTPAYINKYQWRAR